MKKFLVLIIALSLVLSGCNNKNDENQANTQEQNNYTASRTTSLDDSNTTNNTNNTGSLDSTTNTNDSNNVNDTDTNANNNIEITNNTNTEIELSSFSTKIYTPNDEARQNNIRLTCSKLNETIVKARRNIFFL